MKCVVVVGDGMADEPIGALGGKTPLEAARIPNLDRMAGRGILGLTRTLAAGPPAASDIANLAVLGYDPTRFRGGCAAVEAVGRGIALAPGDVAFRLNLVTIDRRDGGPPLMMDFAGGRLSTEEARALVADLSSALAGNGIEIHAGIGYRHLLIWRGGEQGMRTTPPHLIAEQPIGAALPEGPGADRLRSLMDQGAEIVQQHAVSEARRARGEGAPNAIWLWGQGTQRTLPPLRERFGVEGSVVAAASARWPGCRWSMCRAPRGSATPTSAARPSTACAPSRNATFSCCTWRRPTRAATSATRRRRSRPSSGSTRTSWARCSTACGRGAASGA